MLNKDLMLNRLLGILCGSEIFLCKVLSSIVVKLSQLLGLCLIFSTVYNTVLQCLMMFQFIDVKGR